MTATDTAPDTYTHPAFPGVVFAPKQVAVCFYRAGGFFGKAIRWFTRSKDVGHTATFLPRLGVWVEADVGKGDKAKRHPDDVGKTGVVFRIRERADRSDVAVVTLPDYELAERFAVASRGRSYDKRMIGRFLTRQGEAAGTEDDYFCAEHTGELVVWGGVMPLVNSDPSEWSPNDLHKSATLFPDRVVGVQPIPR